MCVSTYYKHINLWQYTRKYPWQRLPGITKEQEEKWHRGLVEGLKREEQKKKQAI
jgi:hypothetical protein